MLEITVREQSTATQSPAIRLRKQRAPLRYSSVHRTQVKTLIDALDGRFVGVDFVKQDGQVRKLNGRLGVTSFQSGGVNKVEADSRPYLTMFDVRQMDYRSVNLATLCSLRADRHVYSIVD